MKIKELKNNKEKVCEEILRSLPKWFGIEDSILEYCRNVKGMPCFVAQENDLNVGFVAIKEHFKSSAEIYVMGIKENYHRKGIGKKLINLIETTLINQGTEFLTVKTLSPTRENAEYAKTRKFYLALGFQSIQEFKTLWGKDNPCLLMAKHL